MFDKAWTETKSMSQGIEDKKAHMDTKNNYVSKPIPNDTVILKEEQDKLNIDIKITDMNALKEDMPKHRADNGMSDTISRVPTPK